jgi:hypothetical protein
LQIKNIVLIVSIIADPYYSRSEVSNSELSWLEKYWLPQQLVLDLENAFRFGSLLDAMITEPEKVDYFKLQVAGVQFEKAEFDKAAAMKKVFFADPFCKALAAQCSMQKVTIKPDFEIDYNGFKFSLPARAKWDFYADKIDLSGDLKQLPAPHRKHLRKRLISIAMTGRRLGTWIWKGKTISCLSPSVK